MLFAHRVDELPYDAAIGAHLEQAPAVCFGDQRVAVRQALLGGARVALEEDLARALVAPDLSTGLRIDLQDARAAAGAELAEIVEQQDVAVGQDVRVVLAGPVAAARPDDLLAVEIDHRSDEHTSELQSLMRIPYAVFCLKKKN